MPVPGATLTVGKTTTLDQIKGFADQYGKDTRILGKFNKETGETVLYVGRKSPSLISLITGREATRKEAAKTAFKQVIARTFDNIKGSGRVLTDSDTNAIKTLVNHVSEITKQTGQHAIRGGLISLLAAAFNGASLRGKDPVLEDRPNLAMLGDITGQIKDTATGLQSAIQDKSDVRSLAETFGEQIATRFLEAENLRPDDPLMFATATGSGLKAALLDAFKEAIGGQAGEDLAKSREAKDFLDIAFNTAASRMLPNSEVPDTKTPIKVGSKTVDLPDITLNGVTYKPDRHLGTGGYADVYAYRATDGSEKEIAYKISNDVSPDAIGAEIRAHKAMAGSGHKNVVSLEGVIRTPDGRLGIAMEIVPKGDILVFSEALKSSVGVGPGLVAPELVEVVRLTLLKDMAEGTRHIQESQGGIHGDLKSPNVLIGSDGVAKLADFGLSRTGSDVKLDDVEVPQNPFWLAPEVVDGQIKSRAIGNLTSTIVEDKARPVEEQIKRMIPGATEKMIRSLASNILLEPIRENQAKIGFTNKSDTWALGVMARDLWTGEKMLPGELFFAKAGDRIAGFGTNPFNEAIGSVDKNGMPLDGALTKSTGSPEVDALVNKLLDPIAEERPSLTTVVNDPLFDKAGVGSPEARALIVALAEGNWDKIDQAKAALKLAMERSTGN